jgi:ABC-2 type transport system ATP-binding protein
MVQVAVADRTMAAAQLLQKLPGIAKVTIIDDTSMRSERASGDGKLIQLAFDPEAKGGASVSDIPNVLVNNSFRLLSFSEESVNLETAFMRLTKGVVQ